MNAWNNLLRWGAAALLLGLLHHPALAADAAEFFVAPDGNDNWQGTKDRPLATVERARDKVRELKKAQGGLKAPVRVVLRGGEYVLPAPLTLSAEDSGSDQAPIVYAAWPGETPVLSGGRVIRNWQAAKVNDKECWVADLAAQGLKDAFIKELFVAGARRPRARLPKQGFFRFDPATPKHEWQKGPESARFVKGDLKNWSNLPEVEMIILNRWFDIHARIARVEETTPTVHFAGRPELGLYDSKNLPARYWVENVKEALTEPGEWYYDRPAAKLYYIPQPGEDPGKTQVIVPALPALVVAEGKAPAAPVRHIRFERLTFRYAEPAVTSTSVQTAVRVPGVIVLRGAERCDLYACVIEKVGGHGVEIDAGSADCRVVACRLQDLGAGGVRINSGSRHSVVSDCTIRDAGRLWLNGAGVYIQNSGWNRIVHNHIHDLHQIGIACGWTWGYAHTETVDNRIEYNRIHDIGRQGLFDDLSGIYTLGAQPGGVERGNVIHDISAYEYGAWGLYTDEGSAYLTLEGNIVYRADLGGFHQHYGRDNLVRNNIFALSALQGLQRSRAEAIRSFTFEKNIVLAAPGAKLLDGKWGDGHYVLRDNVFWRLGGGGLDFAGQGLEEWQKLGRDAGSALADPCFIDPTGGDFTLAPWSPAPGKGFRPLDASQAGPRLLDPAAVPFEKWPQPDETPKVILEGRLETADSLARSGGARFDKALPLTPDHPAAASYVLVNRGPLPAKGEVEFRIEPSGAAALEGSPTLKYELKPGERVEAKFKLIAAPGQKTPPCRLEANAKGEGLFSSVLFFN